MQYAVSHIISQSHNRVLQLWWWHYSLSHDFFPRRNWLSKHVQIVQKLKKKRKNTISFKVINVVVKGAKKQSVYDHFFCKYLFWYFWSIYDYLHSCTMAVWGIQLSCLGQTYFISDSLRTSWFCKFEEKIWQGMVFQAPNIAVNNL